MIRPGESTLRQIARPLFIYLEPAGVTDVCVNKPHEVWVDVHGAWERHQDRALTPSVLEAIATLLASMTGQDVNPASPLCSTVLPDGQRAQVVVPPCVAPGLTVLSVREPPQFSPTMEALDAGGLFRDTLNAGCGLSPLDARLAELRDAGRWREFLEAAVVGRKNIGITGPVGSGKTTLMKALGKCVPAKERLISIEDAYELHLAAPNCVALSYSKGGQGIASKVGATELLEASLRMYPSRVLMGEIRDEAAFTYVRSAAAGHPGSIATWHAKSAGEARDALALMFRQHPAARPLSDATVDGLLRKYIDVIVHCERDGARFRVAEILFDPAG